MLAALSPTQHFQGSSHFCSALLLPVQQQQQLAMQQQLHARFSALLLSFRHGSAVAAQLSEAQLHIIRQLLLVGGVPTLVLLEQAVSAYARTGQSGRLLQALGEACDVS